MAQALDLIISLIRLPVPCNKFQESHLTKLGIGSWKQPIQKILVKKAPQAIMKDTVIGIS